VERQLVFPQPGVVNLDSVAVGIVGPGMVRVRVEQSLISPGTELTAYSGRFNPDSHWGDYVRYPFYPGYSSAGRIVEIGEGIDKALTGSRVFTMWPHASGHILPANAAFPIPDAVALEQANWCALAGVAYVAICRASPAPGESLAIIGAGPVGQMVVRWAAISGAGRILVVDPVPNRLNLAKAGGASHVIPVTVESALPNLLDANSGKRPPVVIDATGCSATLAEALPLVADFGRLVLVGDVGNPAEQHLTSDVIARGVQIIGAHGNYMPYVLGQQHLAARETLPDNQVLEERVRGWRAFSELFHDAVLRGRFPLEAMTSHTFPIADVAEAYAMLSTRRTESMGVALVW